MNLMGPWFKDKMIGYDQKTIQSSTAERLALK